MKVTLISYTPEADNILLFTKNTRLNLSPKLLNDIRGWTDEMKEEELKYMAGTIPSSWEFVDYVFSIESVSRAYTHQQVRTRAGSYAQQTLRVLKKTVGDAIEYVFTDRNRESEAAMKIINAVNRHIATAYNDLLKLGQPVEDARGILPTNIATNIVCKFNLRTLSELARSRVGGRTQKEYQRVCNAMIDAVLAVHPWAIHFLTPPQGRDYFAEIEAFADKEYGSDLLRKGALLKIVDQMRKAA